jgi:hypothetical protein
MFSSPSPRWLVASLWFSWRDPLDDASGEIRDNISTLVARNSGVVQFSGSSDGWTARVRLCNLGNLDISPHFGAPVTIGSLQGNEIVYLGQRRLAIESDSLDTAFSGVIRDFGGGFNGQGGSLTKVGSGVLRLSGQTSTPEARPSVQAALFLRTRPALAPAQERSM